MQVNACVSAWEAGTEVQHPILDRIRSCSSRPIEAVHFFTSMLHPIAHHRPSALTAGSLMYVGETSWQMVQAQEQCIQEDANTPTMDSEAYTTESDSNEDSASTASVHSQAYTVTSEADCDSSTSTSQGYSASSVEVEGPDESQVYSRVPQFFKAAVQVVQAVIRPFMHNHRATPVHAKMLSAAEQDGDRMASPASMKLLSEQPEIRQLGPQQASHSHGLPTVSLGLGSQLSSRLSVSAAPVLGTVLEVLPCHALDLESDDEIDDSRPFDCCDAVSSDVSMASAVSEPILACHAISDFYSDEDEDDLLPEAAEQTPAGLSVNGSAGRISAPSNTDSLRDSLLLSNGHALLPDHNQDAADPAR